MTTKTLSPLAAPACAALLLAPVSLTAQGLQPPPAPFENPITPAKAVLGKVLFWDEQLSSDGSMACGTCHQPRSGGADPRRGRHPGPDGRLSTPDDRIGSPGIVRSTAAGDHDPHALFGLRPQVTPRAAPTVIGAAWFRDLRWDGLARETFVDPVTKQPVILAGAGLESHAVGPPTDAGEMAYDGRTWSDIATRLAAVEPLAMATALPADVAKALAGGSDYGELVRRAFGDRTVTPLRLIYALATYQRTLVPDQTPWDRFVAGDRTALTADQQAGWALFHGPGARCAACHRPPLFSDDSFRNLGLRPVAEDPGWQLATLDPADRGKFKVPTLRNAGLRDRFMHNGALATLEEVVDFYARGGGVFTDNKDPALVPLNLTAQQKRQLVDFVRHGLTDPRVAAERAPFDRPVLYSQRRAPAYGAELGGSGGIAPRPLFAAPPLAGNARFRLGVAEALGGAPAVLMLGAAPGPPGQSLGPLPLNLALTPAPILLPLRLRGRGAGGGHATIHLPIPDAPWLVGAGLHQQWFVVDAAARGGIAASKGSGGAIF